MDGFSKTRRAAIVLSISAALVLLSGCGAPTSSEFKPSKLFSLESSWPWGDEGPQEGMPLRVVGTWTDTVLTQPGQKPQRGFGGRLVFYGKKDDQPILVDGQLVIYAFDETGRDPTDNKPTRRYVFPPEQMPLHMSMSEIGASYSFWLPWDEAGGPRTEVSLICRFEPKGGAVITSEQTRHLLPGAISSSGPAANQPPRLPEGVPSRPARPALADFQQNGRQHRGAQLASYESVAEPQAHTPTPGAPTTAIVPERPALVPERRMTVTSIKLPDNFNLRAGLAHAVAEERAGSQAPVTRPSNSQPQPIQPHLSPTLQPGSIGPAVNATENQHAAMRQLTPQPTTGFGTFPTTRPQQIVPEPMRPFVAQPSGIPAGAWNGMPATQPSTIPSQHEHEPIQSPAQQAAFSGQQPAHTVPAATRRMPAVNSHSPGAVQQ